jgi:hypothetical protein
VEPESKKTNLDHTLFKMSSEYTGKAMADILETSERLSPENTDQACVLIEELVNETSDS